MNEDVVAETSVTDPKDTVQDESAQTDDLDSLLANIDAEFDQDLAPAKPDATDRVAELEKQIQAIQSKGVESAINSSVDTIKQALDITVPDIAIRGWLNEEASKDARIQKAFKESDSNPQAWAKILKSIAGKMSKEFGSQPDPDLNDARQAVTSAMTRGIPKASNEESPNFDGMSDAAFQKWKISQ